MAEFPIVRLYADARVTRIYGGTSEVMKSIISKCQTIRLDGSIRMAPR